MAIQLVVPESRSATSGAWGILLSPVWANTTTVGVTFDSGVIRVPFNRCLTPNNADVSFVASFWSH